MYSWTVSFLFYYVYYNYITYYIKFSGFLRHLITSDDSSTYSYKKYRLAMLFILQNNIFKIAGFNLFIKLMKKNLLVNPFTSHTGDLVSRPLWQQRFSV